MTFRLKVPPLELADHFRIAILVTVHDRRTPGCPSSLLTPAKGELNQVLKLFFSPETRTFQAELNIKFLSSQN